MSPEFRPPEKENFTGIKRFGITTSAWLPNPKQAFAVVNELNKGKPQDQWITIELYPTTPGIFKPLRKLERGRRLIPPKLTPELVCEWLEEFPNNQVEQIHLEFSFNLYESHFHRPLVGEHFFPLKEGVRQRAFQIAWIFFFGPATNRRGIKLAQSLEVGINAHPNVIEGFANMGELEEIKKSVPSVFVENERPYHSPLLKRKGFTSEQLVSDPEVIRTQIIQRYGLDGLTLGIDHPLAYGLNQAEKLQKTKDVVRAMHLAGGKGAAHAFFKIGNPQIEAFLRTVSQTSFTNPVWAALDISPFELRKIPSNSQVEVLKQTFDWIASTQKS